MACFNNALWIGLGGDLKQPHLNIEDASFPLQQNFNKKA